MDGIVDTPLFQNEYPRGIRRKPETSDYDREDGAPSSQGISG